MRGWRRRLISGVLLAVVILAAAGAAAATPAPRLPWWGASLIASTAFVAGLLIDPFKKLLADWIERPIRLHSTLSFHTRMKDQHSRIRKVRDCADPLALGVHPAIKDRKKFPETNLPAYIRRDIEMPSDNGRPDDLDAGFSHGGLFIIEGASAAGKTRTAFEAMMRLVPDRQLIVPAGPASLRELRNVGIRLRDTVVWLDDIDKYLMTGGLDTAIIDALSPPGTTDVLLLGTLRSEARRSLVVTGQDATLASEIEKVMRRARTVTLDRDFSSAERHRAESLRIADSRIAAALDQKTGAGIAEYLAAAPAIYQRWKSACSGENIVAGAIITAAIDARRAGMKAPLTADLLEAAHTYYLNPRERYRPDNIEFSEAIIWACEMVQGASSCLAHSGVDTYEPFDYLVDRVQAKTATAAREATRDVPETVAGSDGITLRGISIIGVSLSDIPLDAWWAFVAHADLADLNIIGLLGTAAGISDIQIAAARRRQKEGQDVLIISEGDTLESATRRAAEAGSPAGMHNLARIYYEEGRLEEAEAWWRKLADTDDPVGVMSLSALLTKTGRQEEAERWLRRGTEMGYRDMAMALSDLLYEQGRVQEAKAFWTQAAEAGSADAMHNLAAISRQESDDETAELWSREVAEAGHAAEMVIHSTRLHHAGEGRLAEQWARRAAEAGNLDGAFLLSILLQLADKNEEAEHWLRHAAELGHVNSMVNLGALLHAMNRRDEATGFWMWAAEHDNAQAMHNLAIVFRREGDAEKEEHWSRRAAEAGHADEMIIHGARLHDAGNTEVGEQWLRRAAESGSVSGAHAFGILCQIAGNTEEAAIWLRRAAEGGIVDAMMRLSRLLRTLNRVDEADRWLERATQDGH